jgi:D-alanine transaminase
VTHPLTNEILGGITRETVLRIATQSGYQVQERSFSLDEALSAKEMFLTGTTTFVLPVVQVDERPIANGAAGTVALDLRQKYLAYVNALDDRAWSV